MKKIAVLFSGQGSNLAYLIEHLPRYDIEISVALTNNPEAGGIQYAYQAGISVEIIDSKSYTHREDFDKEMVEILGKYPIDLTVLAGFMRILTPVFTSQIEAINLHPSLLPRHKGLHAIERSYGDEYTHGGVTVHRVTSELDGGEVVLQKQVDKSSITYDQYYQAIRHIEKEALLEAVVEILG